MKKRRSRKRVIITTLSAVSIGVMLFIGGQLGSENSQGNVAQATIQKADKNTRGKYAAENSEKVKFLADKS